MSAGYRSVWSNDVTRAFRRTVRQVVSKELAPHLDAWESNGAVDPGAWAAAGRAGILLPDVPEEFGGGGGTFAQQAVVVEELARAGVHAGFGVQSIVAQYVLAYGTGQQKAAWLPRMASGELVAAIAMTEPDCGSDLQSIRTTAVRAGSHYVVNGSKIFVTNGPRVGLICLAVRTNLDAPAPRALSMLLVEVDGTAGIRKGRPLEKIGRPTQNVCEIFFDDVLVPAENVLSGAEGRGLGQMMEQLSYERLSIALGAIATAEVAIGETSRYVKARKAYGKTLFDLQATRFTLAECKTDCQVGRVFVDWCVQQFLEGRLDMTTAAMAKYWCTETQFRILDKCLQLHGGYGYMREYPISRMWVDSRVERIYAGSNEVMKEVVGWSL